MESFHVQYRAMVCSTDCNINITPMQTRGPCYPPQNRGANRQSTATKKATKDHWETCQSSRIGKGWVGPIEISSVRRLPLRLRLYLNLPVLMELGVLDSLSRQCHLFVSLHLPSMLPVAVTEIRITGINQLR